VWRTMIDLGTVWKCPIKFEDDFINLMNLSPMPIRKKKKEDGIPFSISINLYPSFGREIRVEHGTTT